MIIDAQRDCENGSELAFDICIVGTGPAGLALALELEKSGRKIGILEAGGKTFSKESQDFFKGTVNGTNRVEHLHSYRYRRLGGTSTAWGGRCLLYDPIDFEQRDYIPDSGWPIAHETMLPFYRRALEWCEAGPMDYSAASVLPDQTPQMIAGLPDGDVVSSALERWSPPTDFGRRYYDDLEGSKSATVVLNAACVALNLDDDRRKVVSVRVQAGKEKTLSVKAGTFILATGGVEVPRLLLASNHQVSAGIGNQHDLVGRYFMTHIAGLVGTAYLDVDPSAVNQDYKRDANGVYVRRRMTFSEDAQRRERIPNVSLQFHYPPVDDPRHGSAVLSAVFMAKHIASIRRGIPPGLGIGVDDDENETVQLWLQHFKNLVVDLPGLVGFLPRFAYLRYLQRRRIPSVVLPSRRTVFPIHYHMEQSPSALSRVVLSDERDGYGNPRARLDFHVNDLDIDGVHRIHTLLDENLKRHGLGEVRFDSDDPKADIRRKTRAVNGHFVGTTRMAEDARNGVVDPDCKVFGTDNLYIASASTFPTSSHANPTLTIVAMAIRLADHLRGNKAA